MYCLFFNKLLRCVGLLNSKKLSLFTFANFGKYSLSSSWIVPSCYFRPIAPRVYTSSIRFKSKGKKSSDKIQEVIRPSDAADILDLVEVQSDMANIVKELKSDFAIEYRVGSDIPLEQMEVTVEGDAYALNEIALISKPTPRLIEVDLINFPEFVSVVEKAILSSKWNLNPIVKGTVIKVPLPQVSAERRTSVAHSAKERLNVCKTYLRQVCETLAKTLKTHEKMTDDLKYILNKQIQIYCDHYLAEADSLYKGKEKEILHPN